MNPSTPDALPATMARTIAVATSKRGVMELPKGSHSNRSPEIDAFRPAWRRAELAKADKAAGKTVDAEPWCAWFVTWCWLVGIGKHPVGGRQIGGCHALARKAQELGLWVPLHGGKQDAPLLAAYPGAAGVLLDQPLGVRPSEGHVYLITGVSLSGWEVSTIEGNSGDQVRSGKRSLAEPRLRGLVVPLGPELARGDWARGLQAAADLSGQGTR